MMVWRMIVTDIASFFLLAGFIIRFSYGE